MLAEIYEDHGWLDREQANHARHHYTGFSVNTERGLKIVSLNSNAFYKKTTTATGTPPTPIPLTNGNS